MVLTKGSIWKENGKAHDIKVLLPIVDGVLRDIQHFILINVRLGRKLVVQVSNCVSLEASNVILTCLYQHSTIGTLNYFYHLFC